MKRVSYNFTVEVDADVDIEGLTSSVSHMISHTDDAYDGERLHMISLHDIVLTDIEDVDATAELSEGPISWEDAAKIAEDYELVLSREEKDGHELHIDSHETIRWVENSHRAFEIMEQFGAKDLNDLYGRCHADKNDPIIRELYKCIGYSLFGFWEIFYWEVNNEDADEYVAPTKD